LIETIFLILKKSYYEMKEKWTISNGPSHFDEL